MRLEAQFIRMVELGSTVLKVAEMLQIPHASAMKSNPGFMTAPYYFILSFTRIFFWYVCRNISKTAASWTALETSTAPQETSLVHVPLETFSRAERSMSKFVLVLPFLSCVRASAALVCVLLRTFSENV
jgi:hypothetical protein